ncbi:hypothetical protein C8Q73DRAFT_767571 [Cubamyces lactineus]|nr:hypothetical protein C8Q73DRAFT_767571 [Cubamyces lactineus]
MDADALIRYRSPHLFLALSASSSASHARLAPRRNLPPTPSRTSHHSRTRIRYWDIAASTATHSCDATCTITNL